jgi:hypothetical protein
MIHLCITKTAERTAKAHRYSIASEKNFQKVSGLTSKLLLGHTERSSRTNCRKMSKNCIGTNY